MKPRLKKMWELAIEEAKELKKNLTTEEKDRLDKEKFDPQSRYYCVYGLATGSCNSDRAIELIKKSCSRVYSRKDDTEAPTDRKLNGKPFDVEERYERDYYYFSPIEILIYDAGGGTKAGHKIIDFIKGETKTIKIPVETKQRFVIFPCSQKLRLPCIIKKIKNERKSI